MDSEIFRCAVCGSVLKNVNPHTRSGYCEICEENRILPREKVNAAPQVVSGAENAVRAFVDKNFELAYKGATDVLENAYDNLPARFIEAFHKGCSIKFCFLFIIVTKWYLILL